MTKYMKRLIAKKMEGGSDVVHAAEERYQQLYWKLARKYGHKLAAERLKFAWDVVTAANRAYSPLDSEYKVAHLGSKPMDPKITEQAWPLLDLEKVA